MWLLLCTTRYARWRKHFPQSWQLHGFFCRWHCLWSIRADCRLKVCPHMERSKGFSKKWIMFIKICLTPNDFSTFVAFLRLCSCKNVLRPQKQWPQVEDSHLPCLFCVWAFWSWIRSRFSWKSLHPLPLVGSASLLLSTTSLHLCNFWKCLGCFLHYQW